MSIITLYTDEETEAQNSDVSLWGRGYPYPCAKAVVNGVLLACGRKGNFRQQLHVWAQKHMTRGNWKGK